MITLVYFYTKIDTFSILISKNGKAMPQGTGLFDRMSTPLVREDPSAHPILEPQPIVMHRKHKHFPAPHRDRIKPRPCRQRKCDGGTNPQTQGN